MTEHYSTKSTYTRPRSMERRLSPRHPFTASATVIEPRTRARMSARTSDLDHLGCYIDTMNPFSAGTAVTLSLTKDNQTFQALAKVVYAHTGMGMGLLFDNPDSDQMYVLDRWLKEPAPVSRGSAAGDIFPVSDRLLIEDQPYDQAPQEVLRCLIEMLMQKKVLLALEGQALLEKLLNRPAVN